MNRRGDSSRYELLSNGTDDRGPGWPVMALELFKIKVSCWFLLNSPTTVCLYTDSCRQTCMHAPAYSSGLDPFLFIYPLYQGFITHARPQRFDILFNVTMNVIYSNKSGVLMSLCRNRPPIYVSQTQKRR